MKILRILEISWLAFGITGVGLGLYSFLTTGAGSAILPLAFSLIAFTFYWVRRKQRIAFEKQKQDN
ncbi:MAG: hypothetical protein ACK5C5_09410 [Bacteroidota bacterium]|jgi:hypothetical protein